MNRIVWGKKACSWMRRRKRRDWVIAGAVVGATIVGIVLGLTLSRSDGTSATTAKGQATVQVSRGDILRTLTVYGEVVPKQEYTFTFDGDRVNEILASVGQRVEQDRVLVELDSTQQELAMLQAERALQEARAEGIPAVIREKELSFRIAQATYEDATLRAPFAGVVTEINQATTSSENWSLVLIDTSELYVEATVDQLDAPEVATGQKAEAVIEPLPDQTWTVEIVEVGGMAVSEGNSTVVVVTAQLPEADPSILVGYTVEMEITTASATDVLILPISCLLESPRGWMVMKVVDDKPMPQEVTIGATSDTYVEIQNGLQEGDLVLLNLAVGTESQQNDQGQSGRFPPGGMPMGGFGPGMP